MILLMKQSSDVHIAQKTSSMKSIRPKQYWCCHALWALELWLLCCFIIIVQAGLELLEGRYTYQPANWSKGYFKSLVSTSHQRRAVFYYILQAFYI